MVLLKTLNSLRYYTVLRHQKASLLIRNDSYNSPISLSSFSSVQPRSSSVISLFTSSIFQRTFSDTAQLVSADVIEEQIETQSTDSDIGESTKNLENKRKKDKKKKEGIEKNERNGSPVEELKEEKDPSDLKLKEIKDLKNKLRKLEEEVKNQKGNDKGTTEEKKKKNQKKKKETLTKREDQRVESKPKSLYSLFTSKPKSLNSVVLKNSSDTKKSVASKQERVSGPRNPLKNDKPINKEISPEMVSLVKNSSDTKKSVVSKQDSVSCPRNLLKNDKPINKEISPEMVSLVIRWHKEGYLNDANFLPTQTLDHNSFSNHYSRDFLRFTAERFGRDHQEIAKWLSGANLKTVALFGCPSVEKKTAFAAKRLRSFFKIQEDTVCRTCKLKNSCKVVNKRVWQKADLLNLPDVMRILTLYDLELVPEELEIPDEIKTSIKKLLTEVINLSQ
ncbi:hypothetical protein BVC80_1793g31 [Macleaya cordata]|uniref:Uncharacterized protein n=1 Tax=Macleaya cordata TaxID=56857 RepID=A0A200QPS6_MACCD|nr:hypothetical protein BVC80_1793g31 [Macleaya cordata]